MVFLEKGEELLELEKVVLLQDLRVDVWGSQRLDLGNEKIANALNGLDDDCQIWCACSAVGIRTFSVSFSNSGPRSSEALLCGAPADFFLCMVALLSTSVSTLDQDSSIWPSDILEMVSGDTLSSSTSGPSAFSTPLRSSSLLLRAVERACSDSMSADTAARSLRKLARFVSTEFKTSSQAVMDRCRSWNLVLSFSSEACVNGLSSCAVRVVRTFFNGLGPSRVLRGVRGWQLRCSQLL